MKKLFILFCFLNMFFVYKPILAGDGGLPFGDEGSQKGDEIEKEINQFYAQEEKATVQELENALVAQNPEEKKPFLRMLLLSYTISNMAEEAYEVSKDAFKQFGFERAEGEDVFHFLYRLVNSRHISLEAAESIKDTLLNLAFYPALSQLRAAGYNPKNFDEFLMVCTDLTENAKMAKTAAQTIARTLFPLFKLRYEALGFKVTNPELIIAQISATLESAQLHPERNKDVLRLLELAFDIETHLKNLDFSMQALDDMKKQQGKALPDQRDLNKVVIDLTTFDPILYRKNLEVIRLISDGTAGILDKIAADFSELARFQGSWLVDFDGKVVPQAFNFNFYNETGMWRTESQKAFPEEIQFKNWMLHTLITQYADRLSDTLERVENFEALQLLVDSKSVMLHPLNFPVSKETSHKVLRNLRLFVSKYTSIKWKKPLRRWAFHEWLEMRKNYKKPKDPQAGSAGREGGRRADINWGNGPTTFEHTDMAERYSDKHPDIDFDRVAESGYERYVKPLVDPLIEKGREARERFNRGRLRPRFAR